MRAWWAGRTPREQYTIALGVLGVVATIGYVGVLGSRHVHRARHTRLRRLGVDDAFIARLRGPAGLDVGAWTPAETAVSIVAEILAVRSGRSGRPFHELDSPIHP
jgi:xanthine dehydrogenase accessory factor